MLLTSSSCIIQADTYRNKTLNRHLKQQMSFAIDFIAEMTPLHSEASTELTGDSEKSETGVHSP